MNWFVDKFNTFCSEKETAYATEIDFALLITDIEVNLQIFDLTKKKFYSKFGYRFASIICPKSRRISAVHLLSSLEIIASLSTDAKWLSWLKYQFTEAIKGSRASSNELYVTLNDFIQNFNFKEPFLAHRLFAYLDKDHSGTLSLHEFINGLEVVVNGSQEEKMEFLFKVFDVDNDGVLNYEEMRMMLKCCLDDTPSLDKEETVDDLAAALFRDTDSDESGEISLEELKSAFKRHESLFKTLSVSTSIWIKPKFINKKKQKWYHKLKEQILNNSATVIFWTCYGIIHFLCALTAYLSYRNENLFVIIARICGNSLNFNCSFILVLVLRKHLTWLRSTSAATFLPLDDSIEIHKIIGIVILVESLIHTIAHFINLYIVCVRLNFNYWTALFTWQINLGFPTGIIELVLLFIILLFAMSYVRNRGYFQMFYWFHALTIPWLIIMLSHGKVFWRWILLPGFCYAIEKIFRYKQVSSNKYGDSYITEALVLPSKVTFLVIRRPPKFHFKPGDYIFINIPSIAKYEWHPFSISSAPEKSDYIWLHVKACGNWTKRLLNFSSCSNFDMCSSFTSQRSSVRHALRARMSKVYSDESHVIEKQLKEMDGRCCNQLGAYKKTVSFETQCGLVRISNSKLDSQVPNSSGQADNKTGDNAAQLKHKGILKLQNQGNSFNGNETISDGANANDIIESTPKFGENKTVSEASNKDANDINLSLNEEKKNDEKNFNLADDYFADKDKLTKSIVTDEKKNSKEGCVIVFDGEKDNSIESRKNNVFYKNQTRKDDDILGYLKMYQKQNRVNIQTIGPEHIWRLKVSFFFFFLRKKFFLHCFVDVKK